MNFLPLFKALSDETRMRLLHLSIHFELNVNEIVGIMGMGQSRISRHLKILTDCGLLTFRKDGLWVYYSAASEGAGFELIESIKYIFNLDSIFKKDQKAATACLAERSEKTARFFDSIAVNWELLKSEILGDVDLNSNILRILPSVETIVDLGCGTGDLLPLLKKKARQVIGVEKSARMLEEARKYFAPEKNGIDIRIGELEHLPLRDEEADAAVTNMVLHHLPEPRKAFEEAFRVLKPGGILLIIDLLSHQDEGMREKYGDLWLGFSTETLEKWLTEKGFTQQKIERFDLKKGLKGFFNLSIKK
ncbi:ArsR/SmtB family transcription factor [Acidobacteriota bacterium]